MGGTLLLADDSITIQKVVELTFAETEHKVVAVGSGRDLFKRLPETKPDVVLCDVVMPDVNGYEVCQTLKSDPNTLHIPVVLLTGTFEPFDRDRALAAGCDAIVTKPFEARELINVVEDLLRRVQAVAATPPLPEVGAVDDGGIPEGVAALDFSTSGFDKMVAQVLPPPSIPEDGIDLTASSLGDSRPSAPMLAPPELAGPETPTAVSSQSFAFGGDEPAVVRPVPTAPPPASSMTLTPEPPSFEPEPDAFGPEPPALTTEPLFFAPDAPAGAEPFALDEAPAAPDAAPAAGRFPDVAPEPAHAFAAEPTPESARERAMEEWPTQRFPAGPSPMPQPAAAPAAAAPRLAAVALEAAPLVAGTLPPEAVEHIARRVAEMMPRPEVLAPPTAADLLTDEHVERIARRAAAFVPIPPAPAPLTAADLLTDEHVDRIARRAADLVPVPPAPAPLTAADLLTDEHVDRIARRAADLVPVPPAPAPLTAADLLTDEHVDRIARRAADLVPIPPAPAPLTAADLLTDEHIERIATRAAALIPPPPPVPARVAAESLSEEQVEKIARRVVELAAPQLERIAWEIIPDMAEMLVRKRIAELEKSAEEES